jgi:hypothetical protein
MIRSLIGVAILIILNLVIVALVLSRVNHCDLRDS